MVRTDRTQRGCRISIAGSALGGVLFFAAAVAACNVPVFRYALERWKSGVYQVTVYHRGPLSAEDQECVRSWERQSALPSAAFAVRTFDLEDADELDDEERATASQAPEFPWVDVQYPNDARLDQAAWSGPLHSGHTANLFDSPVRRELIRELAAGRTAVWLLLESGDPAKDTAAAALLQEQLQKLEQELKLPELTESPDDELLVRMPLAITFSLLRVARNDPAEHAFLEMLLHCESDLTARTGDPLAFPVFGRGRALFPLVGAGITAENIFKSAGFLVEPCSCQIKESNPGFDLLLTADWNALLFANSPPPRVGFTHSENVTLVPIPVGSTETNTVRKPETFVCPIYACCEKYGPGLPVTVTGLLALSVFFAVRRVTSR